MTLLHHPLVLPPRGATELVKLGARGGWSEPRLPHHRVPAHAYLGLLGNDAFVWVAHCKCEKYIDCPLSLALEEAGAMFDAVSVQRRPAATPKRGGTKAKKKPQKK